jgi:hypothetical protein
MHRARYIRQTEHALRRFACTSDDDTAMRHYVCLAACAYTLWPKCDTWSCITAGGRMGLWWWLGMIASTAAIAASAMLVA